MNGFWIWLPITLIALALGIGIGYLIKQNLAEKALQKEKAEADSLVESAKKRSRDIELQAKNQALELRQTADSEISTPAH